MATRATISADFRAAGCRPASTQPIRAFSTAATFAGRVRGFRPAGYPDAEPMVPHGMAVALTAPEAFRFTFESAPERHLRAASWLAPQMDKLDDQRSIVIARHASGGRCCQAPSAKARSPATSRVAS